ncbi:AraC family transcriptional regulator ligand-binding domain-containing protein [Aquipseudomonas campi]
MRRPTSVSAVAVLDLHDLLLDMGLATAEQMSAAGVHRDELIDRSDNARPLQEQRLDEKHLLALWQIAANNTRIPHVGLVIGQTFNPATRGVLASWLFQCTEAGEALHVFQKHIALMNPSESWTVTEIGEELVLEFSFAPDKPYPQAAIERSMSALLRWGQEMTGVPITPNACEFRFPRPAYAERYVEVFGSHLHFDSPRNSLHLPRAFLHAPIGSANSYLKHLLEERALQAFQHLQVNGEWLNKVRQLVQATLKDGVSIEQVCQTLHVSRPTLYRRLKEEGTSFTELVSAVRKDLAYKQIQQGLPIATVSEALGFKDVSTFHRAFKRWFNQSPGAIRGPFT